MRPFLTIAHNDLRRRLRDRSLLVQTVVGPLLLAAIISLALGDTSDFEPRFGVAVPDGAPVAADVASGLEAADGLDVRRYATSEEMRQAVEDDDVGAGISLPAGLGDLDPSAPPVTIAVVVDGGDSVQGAVAESIASTIVDDVVLWRVATGTAVALGVSAADAAVAVAALDDGVSIRETGAARIDPASYFAPSMALLFVFFAIGAGARSFIAEEKDGTLARLRAAPVRPGVVLGAKQSAVVIVGLASVVAVWLASSALIGADWGPPGAVLAVVAATVLAVAGLGALVTGLARTEAQADGYTLSVGFVLALLGGNFVDPSAQGETLSRLARFTPNGQALQAFTDLAAGAGAGAAVVPVLFDLAVAAVAGFAGWRLLIGRSGA